MKKRIFKQGMALMLAAALALPANVVPAEILDQQTETELPHIVLNQEHLMKKLLTVMRRRRRSRLERRQRQRKRQKSIPQKLRDRSFTIPVPSMFTS